MWIHNGRQQLPGDDKGSMTIQNFTVIDDFLDDPYSHLDDIFNNDFSDIETEVGVFKNIQNRADDIVSQKIMHFLPGVEMAYNFARLSPVNQEEPTYIHSDDVMGDITCLLYLNRDFPNENGTTIYDDDKEKKAVQFFGKFNRMIIFDAKLFHSRNIFSNFGVGKDSRLVQVIFLKIK